MHLNAYDLIFERLPTFTPFLLVHTRMIEDEIELLEDEEEEDPVFVLTDEWRDFFAKSEAKRKLGCHNFRASNCLLGLSMQLKLFILCFAAKKQAKKGKK